LNFEGFDFVKIGIKVMGCRLNRAEAGALSGALEYEGHEMVAPNAPCDILVLHSCTITAAAHSEAIRLVRSAKRKGVGHLVMSGCVANLAETEILFDAGVDTIIKKDGEIVQKTGKKPEEIFQVISRVISDRDNTYLPSFASTRASVKVQDGCNFRCAYCIVPDARGEPASRALNDIVYEVRGLADKGYREVVLTGVNVACWSEGEKRFTDLIEAVIGIKGIARVRLSSIEPGTAEREIADLMAVAGSALCHTLHYPLQSGDAGVLKLMRRRYTPADYAAAVEYALSKIPRLGLGADVITGFPGETESAFNETVKLIERYPFSNLHIFPYSERPGTPAASMPDSVPVHVRRERARELIAMGKRKKRDFAKSFVGSRAEVLVERVDESGVGRGWTSEYIEAYIKDLKNDTIGELVTINVNSEFEGKIRGSLI
jgi:threonylcarbamoyladenosine tRNA methylthiotransferase MtaB